MIGNIKSYVISCSADTNANIQSLYVWGEMEPVTWLPDTIKEAKKRIKWCKDKRFKCDCCDAEVHEIIIKRIKKTRKQISP